MMFLYDLFFAVSTGFIGSLLVVLFLYSLKPKIEISQYIADQSKDNDPTFGFKIINKTPYSIIDIRFELALVTPMNVKGGTVFSGRQIGLIRSEYFEVGAFDKKSKDNGYALRIGTGENIRELWTSDTQDLRLTVIAKHCLSGFSSVFSKTYHTKADIKVGKHVAGNSLEVEPVA